MQVEIWSDIVCPWCYLGKRRFERALETYAHADEVEVVYRSFELDPTAPTGSTTPTVERLAAKYGMTAAQATDAQRQMEQRAADDGLRFDLGDLRSGNTRNAHRLLHLAKDRGRQPELAERLHWAYFSEQGSVFDAMSLTALAVSVGLDSNEVADVLSGDRYDDAVAADEATAAALGISGVPFYVIDRRLGVSGAQTPDVLVRALDEARTSAA
jgi:predicted DsbA family dithiol-disulfide isomerase